MDWLVSSQNMLLGRLGGSARFVQPLDTYFSGDTPPALVVDMQVPFLAFDTVAWRRYYFAGDMSAPSLVVDLGSEKVGFSSEPWMLPFRAGTVAASLITDFASNVYGRPN